MYNENMKKDSKKDMNSKKSENPNHKHEIPRLNRAIGQLEGIKKMIEEQRYCPDIIVQLRRAGVAGFIFAVGRAGVAGFVLPAMRAKYRGISIVQLLTFLTSFHSGGCC